MMKLLANFLFMLLLQGCLDDGLANRPTLSKYANAIGDDELPDESETPSRPDGAVYLNAGFCGCKDGEPITLGNCASFCAGKSSSDEILYLTAEVGEDIETSNFGNLNGWCNNPLTYIDPESGELVEEQNQAYCAFEVKDENGELFTIPEPTISGSSIQISIGGLEADKTYRLTLKEGVSGASSANTIQVRKVSNRISDPVGGPLRLMSVNQYTCMTRTTSTDDSTGETFFESAARTHYYFIAEDRPEPLSEAFSNIYCHDFLIYGTTPINNPLFEESPKAFTVWDKWDPRFFDLDGPDENGDYLEIHKILDQKIKDLGYTTDKMPEVFFPLEYYNTPPIAEEGRSAPEKRVLGYYMQPFIDATTYKAYCPKAEHYYSGDNPLFQAMKEVVGVDTEGLYIAKQDNVCDIILINESLLKQIWFYVEDGQNIQPNDNTVAGKQIQFYWPADTVSPTVKKSHQKVYTIKRATDSICGDSTAQTPTEYPPHDKRIGCVPKL